MENKKNDLDILRHSASHILAAAVLEMFPKAKFAIGPSIENGFYYDFELPRNLTPEDLPILEEKMRTIIKSNFPFDKKEITAAKAQEIFSAKGGSASGGKKAKQSYKLELIKDLVKEEKAKKVTIYTTGSFVDLCRGPHLASTGQIKPDAFKLLKIAGAYWRGDEKNKMLQRIYGTVWESKTQLDEHLKKIDEAEKRDHRKLGKELDLFVISDLVGPGMPLYTFKGATIRREIINYSNELQKKIGYQEVHTPNMNKAELFKVSGHYEKYKEDMFKVISNYTKEEYFLKPMNCPHHTQIYAAKKRSYRELPIRIADFANLYRDEKPGELSGLTRLRCFCQDDGHCFCREDQIEQEFLLVLEVIRKAMKTYKMDYIVRLSFWDKNHPEKYLGDAKIWEKSQRLLEKILVENKIDYVKAEGEAALYGPKMDLISTDSIGREWQISTIQLDFIMPQRFGLTYIDEEGKEQTPVMIHRAIVGSPERFLGILIEHYAGAFPAWLSPEQVWVLPIASRHEEYANKIADTLKENNIRVIMKNESETVGKKIREGEQQKIPYLLIVGDKEIEALTVAVRQRGQGDLGAMKTEKFIEKIVQEIKERA